MKNIIKNKKGKTEAALLTSSVFWGLIGLIIFLIFLWKGGTDVITSITDFLKQIPAWTYIAFAVILIFLSMRKRGRRR